MSVAKAVAPAQLVEHPWGPLWDARCRVLVLGSMPSPASRQLGFYYGHPRNRFWRVLAALWDEEVPESIDGRRAFCLRHNLALWDVLASCTIVGASDASIKEARPNDIGTLLTRTQIERVFCTGTTATRLYRQLIEPLCGFPCTGLPSTSPANARMSLSDLVRAYAALRDAADTAG